MGNRILIHFLIAAILIHPVGRVNAQQSIRRIDREIDLAGNNLILAKNTILSFVGDGMIKNGTITGDRAAVEIDGGSPRAVFNHVVLKGTWTGFVDDRLFTRESIPEDDWQILSNIM